MSDPSQFLELEGGEHEIELGSGVELRARVLVRGRRNRLLVGAGASAIPYAPAGFAATVPDPGATGSHAIVVDGDDNLLQIGAATRLGLNMAIRGDNNQVVIGEHCHLHGFVNVLCSNGRLAIGARTTMVQGSIQIHEPGEISFGEDCMISSQVYVSLSDIHPIYDRETGQRINPAASVSVGDHVWAGLRCMILKGAIIGDGAVVAAGAIVSGETPPHAVVAGVPGRVVRENVEWRRDFDQPPPTPTPAPATRSPRRLKWFGR